MKEWRLNVCRSVFLPQPKSNQITADILTCHRRGKHTVGVPDGCPAFVHAGSVTPTLELCHHYNTYAFPNCVKSRCLSWKRSDSHRQFGPPVVIDHVQQRVRLPQHVDTDNILKAHTNKKVLRRNQERYSSPKIKNIIKQACRILFSNFQDWPLS